jgi:hypothetical protein
MRRVRSVPLTDSTRSEAPRLWSPKTSAIASSTCSDAGCHARAGQLLFLQVIGARAPKGQTGPSVFGRPVGQPLQHRIVAVGGGCRLGPAGQECYGGGASCASSRVSSTSPSEVSTMQSSPPQQTVLSA